MRLAILALALLTGCATPVHLPLSKQEGHYSSPVSEDHGEIYVYREKELFGAARGIFVLHNGQRVGGVNSGTYFVIEAPAGRAEIAAENTQNPKDSVVRTINVAPKTKYYLRASLKAGFWDAQPFIEIMNAAEGEQAVLGLSYERLSR